MKEGGMMEKYSYSVGNVINDYFGDDAFEKMNQPHRSWFDKDEYTDLLPLYWQYANDQALHMFIDRFFLKEVIFQDDYIAYIVQKGEQTKVVVMFMLTEDEIPFCLSTEYAKAINKEWLSKGYESIFLSVCIDVEHRENGRVSLGTHTGSGKGCSFFTYDEKIDGLVYWTDLCWHAFYDKLSYCSRTLDIKDWECILEPDVEITKGDKRDKQILAKGISEVVDRLNQLGKIKIFYKDVLSNGIVMETICAGEQELNIAVSRRNLIAEIILEEKSDTARFDSVDESDEKTYFLIPSLVNVTALDIHKMHGYVLQLIYEDGQVRHYYLKNIFERNIPDEILVDESIFNEDIFNGFSLEKNCISFSNGYRIPLHILFYRSYRQLVIERTGKIIYEDSKICVKSIYKVPLEKSLSHFSAKQYWGFEDELYGPNKSCIISNGNMISNVAAYSFRKIDFAIEVYEVHVEPTGLYGYMREDGSWFIPPIYSDLSTISEHLIKATREEDGVKKSYLVNENGEEVLFNYKIDIDGFHGGLCPVNVKEWDGEWPKAGFYYEDDYEVEPGLWGFLDEKGNMVIKPEYTYAIGFWNADGEHCIVAKYIDGELLWGAIDKTGKVTIPCKYERLYTKYGDAVVYRLSPEGLYGIMDFDGNIITEPIFEYVDGYDEKHMLVSAGEDEDSLGVYSVEKCRFIIDQEYDCIDYDDAFMSCEIKYTAKERYFDYEGNEIDFSEYERIFEYHGELHAYKNGKAGVLDINRNIKIPFVMAGAMDSDIELYKKGYVLSGTPKCRGLSKLSGEVIIPEMYTEVVPYKDCILASKNMDGNWCIWDYLYTYEGNVILAGMYRNIYYDRKEDLLSFETPTGKEYAKIERKAW